MVLQSYMKSKIVPLHHALVVESAVDPRTTSDQKEKCNDFWSDCQDSNLRVPNAVNISWVVVFRAAPARPRDQ